MTLYEETVRLVDTRVSEFLTRRRNMLACAVEQSIEDHLAGLDQEDAPVSFPDGVNASEIAEVIRSGEELPAWVRPLVDSIKRDRSDVW